MLFLMIKVCVVVMCTVVLLQSFLHVIYLVLTLLATLRCIMTPFTNLTSRMDYRLKRKDGLSCLCGKKERGWTKFLVAEFYCAVCCMSVLCICADCSIVVSNICIVLMCCVLL
jgi:hypothetical protein